MASVTVRDCALCVVSLLNFVFVFMSGADLVRFLSFRAIYHNITGETKICQGKTRRLTPLEFDMRSILVKCSLVKTTTLHRLSWEWDSRSEGRWFEPHVGRAFILVLRHGLKNIVLSLEWVTGLELHVILQFFKNLCMCFHYITLELSVQFYFYLIWNLSSFPAWKTPYHGQWHCRIVLFSVHLLGIWFYWLSSSLNTACWPGHLSNRPSNQYWGSWPGQHTASPQHWHSRWSSSHPKFFYLFKTLYLFIVSFFSPRF